MKNFSLLLVLLLSCLWFQAAAQDRTISGRVTDRATSQGLPGVTVLARGTTNGTSTNADGAFTLSVPASVTTLAFSYIGYTTIEQPIGNSTNVNVSLAPDAKQIGEVVITGALGIQRQEREVGYATATLDTKETTQARPTNVVNGLAGKVSGLQIQTLSAGINPEVRVTLRGTRSITGNNQALIVIDGIISTNQVLAALNPDDVASTTILKGANAAALYGSQAANGALIITTRRGTNQSQITLSQTSQFESISFLPKFQNQFGPGSPGIPGQPDILYTNTDRFRPFDATVTDPNNPLYKTNAIDDYHYQYQGFENQQYGPRYDGRLVPFGEALANGDVQVLPYEARPNERRDFFNTGFQMQNGVSFSGGDEKSKFFASYQNVHNNGIVPKDKLDRNSFRFNASRELGRLTVGLNVAYSQQRTDYTSNADAANSVYYNVFMTTSMAPLTSYKDWQNNEYANPNGYYNAYYFNPYFIIDNNRTVDKRNTVVGNLDLSYKILDWLRLQARVGTTNLDQTSLATQNKFVYNSYITGGNTNKSAGSGYNGYVQDLSSNTARINTDVFLSMDKTFSNGNFNVKAILGNNVQQLTSHYNYVASAALATPDLFNLSNRVGNLSGADAYARSRTYAFYADVTLGYKNFLFLHGSGRNDNISILDSDYRSYFYPGVDLSLVLSDAIPALHDAAFLDYAKLRGGIAKVSQPNLGIASGTGVYENQGAYRTLPTFSLGAGFPFGPLPSFTADNQLVQLGLRPETTVSTEAGIELSFFKRRLAGGVTYYRQNSSNQTISATVSPATGYSSYLLNAGEVRNQGLEADLNIVPVRLDNGLTITLGANFNYNNNEVLSLTNDLKSLSLSTGGDANVYAVPGMSSSVLQGSYYERVNVNGEDLVKLQAINDNTGRTRYAPVKAADNKTFGNTQPKYKYGFNASITYKGLTLAGQGEMRTGYVVYHAIGSTMDFSGASLRSTEFDRQDFVYPHSAAPVTDPTTGAVTGYVANTSGAGGTNALTDGNVEFWANDAYNITVAENYVTSGMFFKIREVSLSYALPASLLANAGFIKGLSLNLYGRNLFTYVPKSNQWTDPEFNFASANSNAVGINSIYQTPPTKFYGANLTATF